MAITNAFNKAITEGNIRQIRIMLKDSLLVDPTFERYNEMEKLASTVPGIYDEHDGRPFKSLSSEWSDSYMDILMIQVVGNFSHERVEHLKDVVRTLRPVCNSKPCMTSKDITKSTSLKAEKNINEYPQVEKNIHINNNKKDLSYKEQKLKDQKSGKYEYSVGIGGGALGGSIIGYTIASFYTLPILGYVIGGAVIGGAIGGTVVYLNNEKE